MSDDAVHLIARATLPTAVGCFLVALVISASTDHEWPWLLLSVGGLALVLRAGLMLTNAADTLDDLSARERNGVAGRLGFSMETQFGGLVFLIIGMGWLVGGISVAV